MSNRKKIGIFGGSFDPPHKGHYQVVKLCLDQLDLDKIYIIPSYQTPGKQPSLIPTQNRWDMVQELFQDIPKAHVLDIEINKKRPSFTIDTLKELNLKDRPFFIIGDDLLLSIHTWKNFKEIIKKVHLVAVVRSHQNPLVCEDLKRQKIHFLKIHEFGSLSSSEIKQKIQSSGSIDQDIHPKILSKVQKNYQFLQPISEKDIKENILKFLEKEGGLQPQIFPFKETVYEYIVVVSGLNTRHVRSLYMNLVRHIQKTYNLSPRSVEGEGLFQWLVLDYGFLIIHIFYDYLRNHYRLESLWEQRKASKKTS